VKYLIPVAAVLALAICGLIRRETTDAQPVRLASTPSVEGEDTLGVVEAECSSRPSEATAATAPVPAPSDPAPEPAAAEPSRRSEMLETLKVRLELTPAQEVQVAEALRSRAKELRECQEAYRKTGVFVPREYGSRLIRMKESWYRQIDGVLDSEQHRTFDELVAKGFFRPGTDFTVDLMTMSVIR
jgi:hypothetical protein